MMGCKPVAPIEKIHQLNEAKYDEAVNIGSYQELVRKLIYLCHTRLDITYGWE